MNIFTKVTPKVFVVTGVVTVNLTRVGPITGENITWLIIISCLQNTIARLVSF